jgi:hypothetical protein
MPYEIGTHYLLTASPKENIPSDDSKYEKGISDPYTNKTLTLRQMIPWLQ